jgi:hypothetical protein
MSLRPLHPEHQALLLSGLLWVLWGVQDTGQYYDIVLHKFLVHEPP